MDANGQLPHIQRCAIYTRKSANQGLDREFNSLDTQRAICSAYITSQTPKGWREIPKRYDDGGHSGATLDRPNLRELLSDVEQGLVDIVIVYKLDRITRSLLHFVRLMEFLEARGAALVSITQMFDSSDSMGRLILNVLLTFAQFEREISADRLRDKQRLIRQSGRWYGGTPPFGYRSRKRILTVDRKEADHVKFIFERFAELGTFRGVTHECHLHNVRTRRSRGKTGLWHGGSLITERSIQFILNNPVYIGQIRCKEERFQGLHEPIIDRSLWDKVQSRIEANFTGKRDHPCHLLTNILHDCYGRTMSIVSQGRSAKFYVSRFRPSSHCGRKALRAHKERIEKLVCTAIIDLFSNQELVRSGLLKLGCYDERLDALTRRAEGAASKVAEMQSAGLRTLMQCIFLRVELGADRLRLVVSWRAVERFLEWDGIGRFDGEAAELSRGPVHFLEIPWCSSHRSVLALPVDPRSPIDGTPVPRLLKLLKDARRAQVLIEENRIACVTELAKRLGCGRDHFVRLLRLNYLAPDIVTGLLDGTQPVDLTANKLIRADLPLDWALQRRLLGFPARVGADGH